MRARRTVYDAIRRARRPRLPLKIVIPPAVSSISELDIADGGSEHEHHAAQIAARGRTARQEEYGYGKRSLVETAIFRLKGGVERLTGRMFGAQDSEIAFRISAANKAIRHAKPVIVRIG